MRRWAAVAAVIGLVGCVVSTQGVPEEGPTGQTGPAGDPGVSPFSYAANKNDIYYSDGNLILGAPQLGPDTFDFSPIVDIIGKRGTLSVRTIESNGLATIRLTGPGPDHVDDWHINAYAGAQSRLSFHPRGRALPALAITNEGNIGLGTTSPLTLLDVNGTALLHGEDPTMGSSTLVVRNENPSHGDMSPVIEIEQESSPGTFLFLRARTTKGGLAQGPDKFSVDRDGNGSFAGAVNATLGCCMSSDARLKKNIASLPDALTRLLRLRGVTYEWLDPDNHGHLTGPQIGMIAQEVEKVFPDWVGTGKDGYKTVAFRGFEALAVESIRELKLQNDRLEKDVHALTTKLDAERAERAEREKRAWLRSKRSSQARPSRASHPAEPPRPARAPPLPRPLTSASDSLASCPTSSPSAPARSSMVATRSCAAWQPAGWAPSTRSSTGARSADAR
jgi:hypothetical protein